jgi:pyruvate dehydrogenase E1 component alpha subunit
MRDKSDPIEGLKKELEALDVTEDDLKTIDKDIRGVVAEAADFAEQSPEPEFGELYTEVLVGQY